MIIFLLFATFCLLNIFLWPVNKYEWMLSDDPDMVLPIDDNTPLYSAFAAAPIPFLLLFLIGKKSKKSTLAILISMITLVVVWMAKYYSSVFH